jgi:predicted dehydrogenase
VDLLVVSVKAPLHRDVLLPALTGQKPVFCEWPLGITLTESAELLAATNKVGVMNMICLQGSKNKTLRYAKDLIDEGYIGRVVSANLLVQEAGFGPFGRDERAYLAALENGSNLLTIASAHALFALRHVVGEFASLSASVGAQYDTILLEGSGKTAPKNTPDQVLINGTLRSGAHASVHITGGATRTGGARLTINGAEGDLVIWTDGHANLHRADLTMMGGRGDKLEIMPIPARYWIGADILSQEYAAGVAGMYMEFAQAIRGGQPVEADFEFALRWQNYIDLVQRSSDSGQRLAVDI